MPCQCIAFVPPLKRTASPDSSTWFVPPHCQFTVRPNEKMTTQLPQLSRCLPSVAPASYAMSAVPPHAICVSPSDLSAFAAAPSPRSASSFNFFSARSISRLAASFARIAGPRLESRSICLRESYFAFSTAGDAIASLKPSSTPKTVARRAPRAPSTFWK